MFTALILMCSTVDMKTPETCRVLIADFLYPTEEACQMDIAGAVYSGVLQQQNPGLVPVDFRCVNWTPESA